MKTFKEYIFGKEEITVTDKEVYKKAKKEWPKDFKQQLLIARKHSSKGSKPWYFSVDQSGIHISQDSDENSFGFYENK